MTTKKPKPMTLFDVMFSDAKGCKRKRFTVRGCTAVTFAICDRTTIGDYGLWDWLYEPPRMPGDSIRRVFDFPTSAAARKYLKTTSVNSRKYKLWLAERALNPEGV